MVKWHKADLLNRMYMNIDDGKKIAMPRYFKEKLYTLEERERIAAVQSTKMIEEEMILIEKNGYAEVKKQKQTVAKALGLHVSAAAQQHSLKEKL